MKTVEAKTVILGAQGVGKTSITLRYVDRKFNRSITSTIGASFFSCRVDVEDYKVKLQVWDTAGQERFKSMAPMFYRNANAAILVFDLTSAASFYEVKFWVKELHQNIEEKLTLCVVGNKLDLTEQREVKSDEAQSYAESIGADYVETSALNNEGVNKAFHRLAVGIIHDIQARAIRVMQMNQDVHDNVDIQKHSIREHDTADASHSCC